MAEMLCWRYALDPAMVSVVPNYFIPPADPTILDEPPIERDPTLVLAAGRLAPEKRLQVLLGAMRHVDPGLRLSIAGDGPERSELSALADAYGVQTHFHGALLHAELSRLMLEAGVFVQLSSYEWHPKTVIEAMACGCAVVVADSPGLRDVIRNGETGLIVDPEPEAVAKAVADLVGDDARRDALGAGAREWAWKHFAIASVLEMEVEAMHQALAHARDYDKATITQLRKRDRRTRATRVHFDPNLIAADPHSVSRAFEDCIHGYVKRVASENAARMLAELDARLYIMQGDAAVAMNGGIHPKHDILKFHNFFVERIDSAQRVLDLGSGIGALAESIAERSGAHVTCMEINPNNLTIARERLDGAGLSVRTTLIEGDITADRADGRFDVIVLSNVLEHLTERPQRLREWCQWYRPSRFLIRVPAFERDWRVAWKRKLGVEWRLDPTHEIEHTLEQLRSELAEGGLEVTECSAQWGEYWLVARPLAGEQSAAA
jgi:2-polyprenyl-3-methyl-5-hydroxy-6-metoxy-1,4-benzoquinol methylase